MGSSNVTKRLVFYLLQIENMLLFNHSMSLQQFEIIVCVFLSKKTHLFHKTLNIYPPQLQKNKACFV